LGCASSAGDRADYSEFDLDSLRKSLVGQLHPPLLGQLNISTDPKFQSSEGAGDYFGPDIATSDGLRLVGVWRLTVINQNRADRLWPQGGGEPSASFAERRLTERRARQLP
jgi:hypothetical protein